MVVINNFDSTREDFQEQQMSLWKKNIFLIQLKCENNKPSK